MIVVRFAPSPTGHLHVGAARTALFNFLFARRQGGKFILRIEDTDRSRFQQDALEGIFAGLRWLGLAWDEGPDCGGPAAPYLQSQRLELYHEHAQLLVDREVAYPCFCSLERIEELRHRQEASGNKQGSGYDRLCRTMDPGEAKRRLAAGAAHVIRLKVPPGRDVTFPDLIRGDISTGSDELDDLVLLKSDGFPTYHLANVVDDHCMGVTHVLRGDEWISSTPKHVLLYQAFSWEPPQFAHLPVILAPDGGKLSKRKGAASVLEYRSAGFLPEALFNFLALLGWNPGDDREIMSGQEIVQAFTLERISPKAAVFDPKKLEWMNGQYLQRRAGVTIAGEVLAAWQKMGLVGAEHDANDPYLLRIIGLFQERAKRIPEIAESARYFFADPQVYEAQAVKKYFSASSMTWLAQLADRLEALPVFDHDNLEAAFRGLAEELGVGAGKLIHPARLAVSGVSFGPGLFEMLELLGRETVLRRLRAAMTWFVQQGDGIIENTPAS